MELFEHLWTSLFEHQPIIYFNLFMFISFCYWDHGRVLCTRSRDPTQRCFKVFGNKNFNAGGLLGTCCNWTTFLYHSVRIDAFVILCHLKTKYHRLSPRLFPLSGRLPRQCRSQAAPVCKSCTKQEHVLLQHGSLAWIRSEQNRTPQYPYQTYSTTMVCVIFL